jgi:hypothetical protein
VVRFLVVELPHSILNIRFDICVVFTDNYFSVGGDISVDSNAFLVTDFVNLKIKSAQSFRVAHRGRVYVCVHRSECSYVYEYLYLYRISQKKVGAKEYF